MLQRRGSQQAVDGGQRAARTALQAAPAVGGVRVHRQHTAPKKPGQLHLQPVQQRRLAGIALQPLDAFADLAQRQHAQVQRLGGPLLHPCHHACIGLLAPQLRQHIGIHQIAHSSTSRVGLRSRSSANSSSPCRGERRMNSTSDGAPPPLSRSNASRDNTTATGLPCSVISCGPSSAACFTSSENRALAVCICHVCIVRLRLSKSLTRQVRIAPLYLNRPTVSAHLARCAAPRP